MPRRMHRGRTQLLWIGAGVVLASAILGCFSAAPGLAARSAGKQAGKAAEPGGALGTFEVAAVGAPPGRIAPTRCVAGDHELFLGADLVDPGTQLVVRLVIDPLNGPAVRVYDTDAPFERSVLFYREECSVFVMHLEPTGWIVNDIVVRRLELSVECENEEGATIRGSVSATRCD